LNYKERNVTDVSQMTLEQLEEAIHSCIKCPLYKGRIKAVPGEGPMNADIMFIGEGPGFHEDRQGRPFVGAAGQFLEELLAGIGLTRQQVYIANVIKCRPPGNRDPLPNELSACEPYLDRQIQLIQPRVIVTLGRFSMARFFPGASISKVHGQPKRVGNRLVVPMLHPAAALHQPKWRPLVEADFKKLPGFIAEAGSFGEQKPPPQAQQLSLF
jgi:DNA polymerase